ncbi:uncharacterized protein [Hetaerina americana]|uniref:uncharacterized protein n=1 Tax=Hetaerina americana TaxID=62018 RepID=UPI003A7F1A99
MPPGNNNAKPQRAGGCTYCRKASCKGDSCTYTGFEGVVGNVSAPQVLRGREACITENSRTSIVSSTGTVLRTGDMMPTRNISQVGTGAKENNLTTRGSTVVYTSYTSGFGKAVTDTKAPGTGSSLHPSSVTTGISSTVSRAEPYSSTNKALSAESSIEKGNASFYGTRPFSTATQSNQVSYVSKSAEVRETCRSHSDVQNPSLLQSERGIVSNVIQPANSTKAIISNVDVLPEVKTEKTATHMPPNPIPGNKPLGSQGNTPICQSASTNWEKDTSRGEFNKNDIIKQQIPGIKVDDGIKPPISKPSSCASIISKNSCESDVVDKASVKLRKTQHSRNLIKYEGVVFQILSTRNAKVRVAEINGIPIKKSQWGAANAVHKYALLTSDRILQENQKLWYPSNTPISSILAKGDVVILFCTAHNNPSSGFQLFACEAWLTDQKNQLNNDVDSVTSYCSQTGSETQASTSSKKKRPRNRNKNAKKMEMPNENSYDVSDVVNNWLDTNEYTQNKNDSSKTLKLIAGCHYIGKVIEMRLPFAFIIEISSNDGKQSVFVFANHFHPQGISLPAVVSGVSLESFVNIGDEIVVIPIKNTSMEEHQFEWVASKAWPKNVISSDLHCSNKSEQPIMKSESVLLPGDKFEKNPNQKAEVQSSTYLKNLYPSAKNWKEFDGIILSLQYDWGLVRKTDEGQHAYAFTRKNTYLFGLSLQHFILDDVLQEGQLVKFSMEAAEIGAINAIAVWYENRLPDFNAFDSAAAKYCGEREIKFSTEESLIQHGKSMYVEQ